MGDFVERYGGLVWRLLARFITLTPEERKDLSQDVFDPHKPSPRGISRLY